jgi:predicted nuclease of predicted toxin-antitoxin system
MASKEIISKKRSATSSPPEFTFFIDRCLGKKVASALKSKVLVEVHDDHFAPDEQDHVWLSYVGQRRWIVLTKDKNIRRNQLEVTTLRKAEVKTFILTSSNITSDEMCAAFQKALRTMVRLASNVTGGFIAVVHRNGSVSMLEAFSKKNRQNQTAD